jgi:hypothetical protein
MGLRTQQEIRLLDAKAHCLGHILVEAIDGDYVTGRFRPEGCFAAVEPLFTELIAAANDQLFRRVEELDSAIRALGLHLALENGVPLPDIYDVEIDQQAISFRQRLGRPDTAKTAS